MYKDHDRWKLVIVVNNELQIGHSLVSYTKFRLSKQVYVAFWIYKLADITSVSDGLFRIGKQRMDGLFQQVASLLQTFERL